MEKGLTQGHTAMLSAELGLLPSPLDPFSTAFISPFSLDGFRCGRDREGESSHRMPRFLDCLASNIKTHQTL